MSITIAGTGLIYRNPKPHLVSRHAYFPSLAVLPDGRIFAGFDIGSAFEAVDVRSFHAISADDGETWSEPAPVPLPPFEKPFSCTCRFGAAPDGTIVGMGAVWDRTRPDEGLSNEVTGGFTETFPFLVKADSRTMNWQQPAWMKTPLPGPFEICSPATFLEDGEWLWPASTWKDWDGNAPEGMHAIVLRSSNGGVSWDTWNAVMDGRKEDVIHWEIKLAQFPDGKILAVSWTHDARAGVDRAIHYALSEDGGKTFSTPKSTELTGQTCTPAILPDGSILLIYRRTGEPGLWAQRSDIRDGVWRNLETSVLWGGASHAGGGGKNSVVQQMSTLRFGLPAVKVLPDGKVFAAFWCVEDAVSNIRYFRLRCD